MLCHHITPRSILILPFHQPVGLPTGLFPSGFPTKILYAFHTSPMHTMSLAYFVIDLSTLIISGGKGTYYGAAHYISFSCVPSSLLYLNYHFNESSIIYILIVLRLF
jgi:hypothetical protein